jgi:hypothetical protein
MPTGNTSIKFLLVSEVKHVLFTHLVQWWVFSLRHRFQTGFGPPMKWVPGVKRPGHETDHSPPSNAEVKNAWSCDSIPQYVFMAWCVVKHRTILFLLYTWDSDAKMTFLLEKFISLLKICTHSEPHPQLFQQRVPLSYSVLPPPPSNTVCFAFIQHIPSDFETHFVSLCQALQIPSSKPRPHKGPVMLFACL